MAHFNSQHATQRTWAPYLPYSIESYVSFHMFGKYKVDDLCFRPKYKHPTVSKKYY